VATPVSLPTDKLADKMKKYDDTVRLLLEKLPIDAILKFRERTKALHLRQLNVINEILKAKGFVEPHHEGLLTSARD
jgi:hypothetical protein